MSDRRNTIWSCPLKPDALTVVEDSAIVIAHEHAVIELDDNGGEAWRRDFPRKPYRLVSCGKGVAFDLPDRGAPTDVVALDLDGGERWRFQRRWTLMFQGIAGDSRGVALYGQDIKPTTNHWIGLDPDGTVRFEVAPPAEDAPRVAGSWLIASIGDGERGLVRTDRDGTNTTTITTLAHNALGANDLFVALNTYSDDGPSEVVAIELATGREQWRAPGGNNLDIAIAAGRAAWVEASGRPVVHELVTGRQLWAGDPLPAINASHSYRCKLGDNALVCYCGNAHVAYYALDARSAFHQRAWNRDAPDASRFAGTRFLEGSFHGVVCWELT